MLLDANVLLYSIDRSSRQHTACAAWLSDAFAGPRRVGLPWPTIGAFLRISTHPRAFTRPLRPDQAWEVVEQWLNAPNSWIPETSDATARILGGMIRELDLRGNLITDAQLAALAIEHGVAVVSADTDFARFPGLRWVNPLAG